MTTQTFTAPATRGLDRILAIRITLSWQMAVFIAIFALAVALRTWDLGARSLHHDESIHAQWSWDLLRGNYRHSPIFHGPLYYHAQALVFFIFGASDYTARLSAAIFGSVLVLLPLILRRRLGFAGTAAAMAFLAFSPTLTYYSRFFREDIYLGVFTLLMVAATWRYLEEGKTRWLVITGAAFVAGVLTKEGGFISTAVLLVYLDLMLAANLATRTLAAREAAYNAPTFDEDGNEIPPAVIVRMNTTWRRAILTIGLAPWAWIFAALWPFLGSFRKRMSWDDDLPRSGDLLVLLGTFTLPLLTPVARIRILEPLGLVEKDRLSWEKSLQGIVATRDQMALLGLFSVTTSIAAFAGLQWRPALWASLFAGCAFVYLTLMTSFWTNTNGLISGPWGSLDYWITQQEVARGDQPWFYYYMLMPAYEFLPLTLCLGGAWWMVAKGDSFTRMLSFWLVGIWLALSFASEKMPWNNVHIAVPACMLAAAVVARAFDSWQDAPPPSKRLVLLGSVAAIGAGALAFAAFIPLESGAWPIRIVVLLFGAGLILYAARPFGRAALPAVAVVAVIGAFSLFTVRTTLLAVYERGDVPKDMLIYTQSSPDIPRIASQIDQLAKATGLGYNLPIAVDSSDSYAWPWAWYLRDYKRVGYIDFANGVPQGDYQVLLVNLTHNEQVKQNLASSGNTMFAAPVEYPHRWWFDERYKSAMAVPPGTACTGLAGDCGPLRIDTWKRIAEGITSEGWLSTWANYWRDHDADAIFPEVTDRRCKSCGSVNAFVYLPANFDLATGAIVPRTLEPAAPSIGDDGRLTFGSFGSLPGQFFSPVDAEADAQGNLYVIDTTTKKLQKFDAEGNYLASVDIRDTPGNTAEASEPWGLAVGADGTVVVADTFGWRIRVFDSNLAPKFSFGTPPDTSKEPGPYDLYGPRDAIIDATGNIWVTDTGNDRIVIYSPTGEFVRAFGKVGSGDGEFDEPVGLARDSAGLVYVADMYNSRVVVLNSDGSYNSALFISGWGGLEVTDKPYIEVLRDGTLAVGLPSQGIVRLYNKAGAEVGVLGNPGDPLSRPYGIVETADGKLWVVEGGSARLRLFERP